MREPLPSLLKEANDRKIPIRNNSDMAIFYFTKRDNK